MLKNTKNVDFYPKKILWDIQQTTYLIENEIMLFSTRFSNFSMTVFLWFYLLSYGIFEKQHKTTLTDQIS